MSQTGMPPDLLHTPHLTIAPRQEQDALLEGRTVLAGDDGDWDTEEVDADPEEVW